MVILFFDLPSEFDLPRLGRGIRCYQLARGSHGQAVADQFEENDERDYDTQLERETQAYKQRA